MWHKKCGHHLGICGAGGRYHYCAQDTTTSLYKSETGKGHAMLESTLQPRLGAPVTFCEMKTRPPSHLYRPMGTTVSPQAILESTGATALPAATTIKGSTTGHN